MIYSIPWFYWWWYTKVHLSYSVPSYFLEYSGARTVYLFLFFGVFFKLCVSFFYSFLDISKRYFGGVIKVIKVIKVIRVWRGLRIWGSGKSESSEWSEWSEWSESSKSSKSWEIRVIRVIENHRGSSRIIADLKTRGSEDLTNCRP